MGEISNFAKDQRQRAVTQAVNAVFEEIEAAQLKDRDGRRDLRDDPSKNEWPDDITKFKDVDLEDLIYSLTSERFRRQFLSRELARALHDRLPQWINGGLQKLDPINGEALRFSLRVHHEHQVDLRWSEWVELARQIIIADEQARATLAWDRAVKPSDPA